MCDINYVCGSNQNFTWANCLALYFCVAFGCDWSSALESVQKQRGLAYYLHLSVLHLREREREREVLYIPHMTCSFTIPDTNRCRFTCLHFLKTQHCFFTSWFSKLSHILTINFEHWPQSSLSLQLPHDPHWNLFLLSVMWMVHVKWVLHVCFIQILYLISVVD